MVSRLPLHIVGGVMLSVTLIAQQPAKTTMLGRTPEVNKATSLDWSLHNHDLSSSRYLAATEITAANASTLTLKWSFKPDVVAGGFGLPPEAATSSVLTNRNSFFQQTPIVIDGVMYIHSGSKVYAVNAATGAPIWTF